MSELLGKANELIELKGTEWRHDGWPCHGKYPCLYTDEVLSIIKGYQHLLERVVDEWADYAPHDALFDIIKSSIPKEQPNA
jgi:hypothetical protein